jgi:hypothetical protein
MNALRKVTGLIASLKRCVEAILEPKLEAAVPKESLVKVRLIDLLPPELPGWRSRYSTKRW